MRKLILASGSPRRKELLCMAGYTFEVIPADCDEVWLANETPKQAAMRLALEKAKAVAKNHPKAVVLGSDTAVWLGDKHLGKPKNSKAAFEMLNALSGNTHTVWTGAALVCGRLTVCFASKAHVTFYPLSAQEIDAYIATGEPMDKAGSYAVQGAGARFVQQICGDYPTIVGLPIARVCRTLRLFGIHPLSKEETL